MELMPGYKPTDIGMIPTDWDVGVLRGFVRSHNSGVYKKSDVYGSGDNIIGVSDLYGIDGVDGQVFALVPLSGKEREKYSLRADDLLYGESSLVREGIARTVCVTESGVGTAFAWHTRRYSVDQRRLHSPFLSFFLQSACARKHMMDHSIQTAITGINTDAYFSCPVILPPIAEQRAIAEAIADVERHITSQSRLIAKKRDLRLGAMQRLLTGQSRLPGFGMKAQAQQFSDVGLIPEDWDVVPLGSVGEVLIGLTYAPSDVASSGTLVLRSSNIKDDALCLEDNVYVSAPIPERIMVRSGDVLICVRNGSRALIGKAALLDERAVGMTFGAFMAVFRSEVGELVNYLFQSSVLKRQISEHLGATINQITNKSLNSFKVPLPRDPSERTAIARVLQDMDGEIAVLVARLEKTRALKQAMMQALLTGRVRLPTARDETSNLKEAAYG